MPTAALLTCALVIAGIFSGLIAGALRQAKRAGYELVTYRINPIRTAWVSNPPRWGANRTFQMMDNGSTIEAWSFRLGRQVLEVQRSRYRALYR